MKLITIKVDIIASVADMDMYCLNVGMVGSSGERKEKKEKREKRESRERYRDMKTAHTGVAHTEAMNMKIVISALKEVLRLHTVMKSIFPSLYPTTISAPLECAKVYILIHLAMARGM